jgi:hypothetical protein
MMLRGFAIVLVIAALTSPFLGATHARCTLALFPPGRDHIVPGQQHRRRTAVLTRVSNALRRSSVILSDRWTPCNASVAGIPETELLCGR